MDNLLDIENRIKIVKDKLSEIEITSEIFEYSKLVAEKRSLVEKKSRIKWNNLSLQEKIIKRKEDLSLTYKYFVKFKEEVEKKYLFKKSYVQLIDDIQAMSFNSSLLVVLLKSLNTSMYVDFDNKDFNIPCIIEELEKINTPKLSKIISSCKLVITSQIPI